MAFNFVVSPKVFKALQIADTDELIKFSAEELRPILPCLVRMCLVAPLDTTKKCTEGRKRMSVYLSNLYIVNSIITSLSIDFHGLELDVKKEQMLR